jgi:hypothetical protein
VTAVERGARGVDEGRYEIDASGHGAANDRFFQSTAT